MVPETSQEFGHVVHWILYLDTSKVTGVANTNVTVTATATDRGKPTWNGNETSGSVVYSENAAAITGGTTISGAVTKNGSEVSIAGLTGNYRVDVVPYIKEIKTQLSGSEIIPSAQNRSAKGAYAVRRGEIIEITGFNLNSKDTTNKTLVRINTTNVTPNISTSFLILPATKLLEPFTVT